MSKLRGLYLVQFVANNQSFGEGLVSIVDGMINGGDLSYLYQGRFDFYGNEIQATIEVTHYHGPANSVFGQLKTFSLKLSGNIISEGFEVNGGIPDMPNLSIKITGKKVANLYE